MPSGKTHLKLEAMILVLWTGLAIVFVLQKWIEGYQALLFLGCYIFSMLFMSPDLDLSKSDAFTRWGWLRWIWVPYARIFRHRQASHHPLWGPLSRILAIAMLFFAAIVVYVLITGNPAPHMSLSLDVWIPGVLGLYLPNLEHIFADGLLTMWRRKCRRHRL